MNPIYLDFPNLTDYIWQKRHFGKLCEVQKTIPMSVIAFSLGTKIATLPTDLIVSKLCTLNPENSMNLKYAGVLQEKCISGFCRLLLISCELI